jgi:hypothetical protein
MSGAAGIAAAKNRRSKPENNPRFPQPVVTCASKNNGACPLPPNKNLMPPPASVSTRNTNTNTNTNNKNTNNKNTNNNNVLNAPPPLSNLIDPETLQILGPLPPAQILKYHEQRLNRMDQQLRTQNKDEGDEEYREECFARIGMLESKVSMLEEVIMNLQNKLTIVQNFVMETNLEVSKLKSLQVSTTSLSSPVSEENNVNMSINDLPISSSNDLPISETS